MSTQTSVRVFSPFRNRVIGTTSEKARILRQSQRVIDFYISAASDRSRLAGREWKRRSKGSLLGELEMLDTTVAGVASWCESARRHPDPAGAIKQMMAYDIPELSRRLKGYPQLQQFLESVGKLREMVVEYFQQQK